MKKDSVHQWLFDGKQHCSSHQGKADKAGGHWIVRNGGKSRRWICAACAQARAERMVK